MTTSTSLIDLAAPADRPPGVSATGATSARRPDAASRPAAVPVAIPDDLGLSAPVLPGAESEADWQAHLQGVFDYYAPQGRVEQIGAFRIASLIWRLDRAVRCETDEIALSLSTAEHDAVCLLDADDQLDPADPVARALPRDVAGLRQRIKDAKLAAQILVDLLQATGPDLIPPEHARVALRFVADCAAPRDARAHTPAPLPEPPPVGHWTGATLRTALAHFHPNRPQGDVFTETVAYARSTIALAERRLSNIETLAARFRRQHVVPHSHVAARALEHESHLAALLDAALRQLDALQSHRAA